MENTKRSFFGKKETLSKADYYREILNILQDIDADDVANIDTLIAATEFEIETLELKKSTTKPNGERKAANETDYGVFIIGLLLPSITNEFKPLYQMIDDLNAQGLTNPASGKALSYTNALKAVTADSRFEIGKAYFMVTGKDGLRSEKEKATIKLA